MPFMILERRLLQPLKIPNAPMEIIQHKQDGVDVLSLQGRLDQASADALHAAAMELAGDEKCQGLIIDMGGVDFIASVGIRALIRPSQAISMRGGKMAVANLRQQIDDFFRLTGLDQMFRVYLTVEEAAKDLAS